ncbi:branched-chain amino acid ABC transporter permease [Nocardioides sp. WL0053]|uniref:Branched-chain amino acid ABC transporter permease n=1 Tax=Nocardioides jiangsuensis TaxID=2866161 RepID=A0ABS7RI25_9ACTN|nr:branched-chain amino acid ABC transporter permease [Nocardioides jiangsuensis]MBY9074686.1 branched-chain amino acid ABC transporter permease [Nocardioides jiangsuensis]
MPALPARLSRVSESTLLRHLVLALAGMVVIVLVLESTSAFRNGQLTAMAYLGIAAGGLTVLTGLNGQLSLGHGAFMAIGAYTTALFLQDTEPALPVVGVLVVATLVTLLVGAVVGVAAARLHGPYLAGATLALAVAVPGIAVYFTDTLGGEQGLNVLLPEIPDWFADAVFFLTANDMTTTRYVAYIGWIALVLTFVLLANLSRSRVGRTWRAVRDDEVAAEIAGINLARARVLAFVVSTACAGLAGGVMALAVRITAPSGFMLTLSLTLLTAVVLGGLGSLLGALIGAALLTFLPQVATGFGADLGLSDVQSAELAPLAYGLVMMLVILLAPAGIVGSVRGWWARRGTSA